MPEVDMAREEVERLRRESAYVGLESGLSPQQKAGRVSGHARRLRAAERRYREARRLDAVDALVNDGRDGCIEVPDERHEDASASTGEQR